MTNQSPAVVVKDLYKSFKLPHEQHSGIKQFIVNFAKRKKGYEVQQVLNSVSFEIKEGEFFGIVGRNGSGKSTLLKLLAGIYVPDEGLVQVNGSLTPFIELGVGFNPELTGRENVFMNGALLGFGKHDVESMYDDIVEFAELEKFMDQKLKNYSSGMQVRLAFSIAIRAKSDILLIDEVLAVGDSAFQQKCFDYFERLKNEKRTIIFVTHDMSAVRRFCTRALLLEKGKVKLIGKPDDVASQYTLDNFAKKDTSVLSGGLEYIKVEPVSGIKLSDTDEFKFSIEYKLKTPIRTYVAFSLMYKNLSIVEKNSLDIGLTKHEAQIHKFEFTQPLEHFNDAELRLNVSVFDDKKELLGYKTDACELLVESKKPPTVNGGPIYSGGKWRKVV